MPSPCTESDLAGACHPERTREGSHAGSPRWRSFASTLRMTAAPAIMSILVVCVLTSQTRAADSEPYLLHLPGIGGHMRIDDMVTSGMELGGIRAKYEIHDWTGENTGM